jgi:hypothetical protein
MSTSTGAIACKARWDCTEVSNGTVAWGDGKKGACIDNVPSWLTPQVCPQAGTRVTSVGWIRLLEATLIIVVRRRHTGRRS